MAHHGGQTSLPRAHRPRAPIMSVPAPITAPLAPLRSNSSSHLLHPAASSSSVPTTTSVVSLVTPRPDSERQCNEYVDTPFRAAGASSSPPPPPRVLQRAARMPIPPPPPAPAITKQPAAKDAAVAQPARLQQQQQQHAGALGDARQSIVCGECGRCRCQSCRQPRPLPECWTSTYRCSADTAIDYASCLCCVKGLFYHCSETDGGDTCVDEPCNCGPDRRTARWGCLAALSCVLPCLLLYWPLQCSKRVAEACYARHSRLGCRCRPKAGGGGGGAVVAAAAAAEAVGRHAPEKRLLDGGAPDY